MFDICMYSNNNNIILNLIFNLQILEKFKIERTKN